jgi:hypothetical protein
MPKKLTHEYVYNYYNNENYIMNSIYKNGMAKDSLTCPVGHNIEMTFNNFKNHNSRCYKCAGNENHSQEYVYNYYKENNYIMNSIYKNNHTKDRLICPVGHDIEISFGNFQQGNRCLICSGKEKHSQEFVKNYYANENYILNSIYKGMRYKDSLTCPEGHEFKIKFNDFQQGHKCRHCFEYKNRGINHPRFNPNRDELPLNQRLRNPHSKSWIIKYMKDDPKYQDYLLNPNNFVVDHIIPVKLFCQLFTKYNLDEDKIRYIINKRDNLQLLTWEENSDKRAKGSSLFEAGQYLINNGVSFKTFLEEII